LIGRGRVIGKRSLEYKYGYPSTDKYRMNERRGGDGREDKGGKEEDGEINILMEYK
jgi:hypothetical protein